jgi:hypothetical protein
LDCASPLALWRAWGVRKRQGTAAVQNLAEPLPLSSFDTLTAEAQRAIDLLQARRTALISAAVTGQIDVRAAIA